MHAAHLELGATMVDFAGFEMPLQYTSIIEEHLTVRRTVGMFDVSHMGEIIIRGEGAEALLRRLLTKDVRGKRIGQAVYGHLLDEGGRILDDTIVFRLDEEEFLMIPNASTQERVLRWVRGHSDGVEVIDVGHRVSCLAIQGPVAKELLEDVIHADLRSMHRFTGTLADPTIGEGAEAFLGDILGERGKGARCFVSRTGYTGEDGFEVFVENSMAMSLWNHLLRIGAAHGLRPAGLGARDTLRLEMGYLLSGTDFDGSQTTLQTGPSFALDWEHEFIGREALMEQRRGDYERLVGFELVGRGVPRHGYPIYADEEIGRVTSGTMSPCLGRGIGMGYVRPPHHEAGTRLLIGIRGRMAEARIVTPPFIERRGR